MSKTLFTQAPGIYLLNHSVGALPRSSQAVLDKHFFAPWQQTDEHIWSHWLAAINEFRECIASMLNTDAALVCPQTNLSSALTKILTSLPRPASQKKFLLLSEEDFPSLGFVLAYAREWNLEPRFVPAGENTCDISVWQRYLNDDVFAVLLTHVQSNNGRRLPIDELTQITRAGDIISIVDLAQSAGVIPIDLATWQADFVIGSCVKWLCGGPGAGYLWMTPRWCEDARPRDVGWFSHRDPFEFDIHHFDYAEDALRFWGGTPDVAPYILAANGIKTLMEIGIEDIYLHNVRCKAALVSSIDSDLVLSPEKREQQSGTLIVRHSDEAERRLRQLDVHFDSRILAPSGLRVFRLSPHIYTDESHLSSVASCFEQEQ